jgi:hypothetical protein
MLAKRVRHTAVLDLLQHLVHCLQEQYCHRHCLCAAGVLLLYAHTLAFRNGTCYYCHHSCAAAAAAPEQRWLAATPALPAQRPHRCGWALAGCCSEAQQQGRASWQAAASRVRTAVVQWCCPYPEPLGVLLLLLLLLLQLFHHSSIP